MNTASSSMTASLDRVFLYIIAVSVVLLVLVTALMIYFAIRYHHKRHPRAEEVRGSVWLEITWTVIPLLLVMSMFYFSFEQFRLLRDTPAGAMPVKVTGRMWNWSFEYENGRKSEQLYVPLNRPVKLLLHSVDVNHSFYIPAFRIKEDAVPGRENHLWFKPTTMGPADIFCAEFCGQRHAYMLSKVIVMSEKEFQDWYNQRETVPPAGGVPAIEMMKKQDCLTCHSLDGTAGIGPTFKGIWGRTTVVRAKGREKTLTADEDYLRRAILQPDAESVKGFDSGMPAPEGLSAAEVQQILDYLKTVK